MDRFSPIAPAQIPVLVLPIGQIARDEFLAFLQRLQREVAVVRLDDVPDLDVQSPLAPQAFPHGSLVFNFTSSVQHAQHQQLSPYELFREPLLVIGVLSGVSGGAKDSAKQLSIASEQLKELHPRVVHRQLLILHNTSYEATNDSDNEIHIVSASKDNDPALKPSVYRMSNRFLRELATYTKAMQASPGIQTPGQTSRNLQRTVSLRTDERKSGSGQDTPTHADPSTPTGDEHNSRPPSLQLGSPPPATSFDQIRSANPMTASESKTNAKSKPGARASSQEQVPVHGFGAGTSTEKTRTKGKARVGIVIGHVYMMAGQWNEALRMLIEHTGKARSLSDNLWHAKGLEGILVCLILYAWAGLEFSIPTICFPVSERNTAAHVKRLSISLGGESKHHPTEDAYKASVRRLSVSLPDITKLIVSLYRSGEGSLELPALVVHEAIVRFSKLLAIVNSAKGELNSTALSQIVSTTASPRAIEISSVNGVKLMQKTAIADMLGLAQPSNEDNLVLSDHISILAGIASVYALLQMLRRKAIVVKDILLRLTSALIQARKLGAAEMGIHPAASLSTETGAETILTVVEERGGVNEMLSDLAQIYAVELVSDSNREQVEASLHLNSSLGSSGLKTTIMRELVAFCEASPDPYGVVRLTASLLMSARPTSAIDEQAEGGSTLLFKEEQTRFMTIINRTIGISKHLGLPDVNASYWDPFLVRGIDFLPPNADQLVVKRSVLNIAEDRVSANPLLYDPNADRLSVATQQAVVLVANEVAKCSVTMQNPLDIPVEIESLVFITEGEELRVDHEPFILSPTRIQQVSISVFPDCAGALKIIACRVKIRDCRAQLFQVFNRPWSPSAPLLVKEHGQEIIQRDQSSFETISAPEPATLAAVIIQEQPSLQIESMSLLESSIMLLNGEVKSFVVALRNVSTVVATVFEIMGTAHVLRHLEDGSDKYGSLDVEIKPNAIQTFRIEISGKAGISEGKVGFLYGAKDVVSDSRTTTHYVRCIEVPVAMTVNAALRAQHAEVSLVDSGSAFLLSFDLANAWPKALHYHCTIAHNHDLVQTTNSRTEQKGLVPPSSVERVFLRITHEQLALDHASTADIQQQLWNQVHVSWHDGAARSGIIDLSSLTLPPDALEVIRGSPLQLTLRLLPTDNTNPTTHIGSFTTCRVVLHNRTGIRTSPLFIQLRLRPDGADSTWHEDRHLATTPSLSRLLPPLQGAAEINVDFVLCPLVAGRLQILATCVPADLGIEGVAHGLHAEASEKWQACGTTVMTVV